MFRYFVLISLMVSMFSTPVFSAQTKFKGYNFKAYVVKANGQYYREFRENNKKMLKVRPNEEYKIVVHNPLPVRVAVAVSIDGLNTIDGKRTSPRNAQKWMISPKSSITIKGWQTSKKTLRSFLFTKDTASFAKWREDKYGKPFTQNLGVVGVAWFWNKDELYQELHPPQPFVDDYKKSKISKRSSRAKGAVPSSAPAMADAESKAGTGMGRQQHHHVKEVKFNADTGMYTVKDVLKIYYEFAKEPAEPQPFINDEKDGRFTEYMHK